LTGVRAVRRPRWLVIGRLHHHDRLAAPAGELGADMI
jgi:hypothetical protein